MSTKERETRYHEAERYMNNAIDILRTKANKKDGLYQDVKYVKMACGTAYSGVLHALDTYFEMKGKPIKEKRTGRTDVDVYRRQLGVLDKKLLDNFNIVYSILHLAGYYDGIKNYKIIREAMNTAIDIVNKIKPFGHSGLHPAI
jgi:Domain of unknown function (DUF5618)